MAQDAVHAHHRLPLGHVVGNDSSCADDDAIVEGDVAEDHGAGADLDVVAHLGVAVKGAALARGPQRHPVQNVAAVADGGSLADDDARRVVKHHRVADARAGVCVHAEDFGHAALERERDHHLLQLVGGPQHVGEPLDLDRVEPFEEEKRLDVADGGRVDFSNPEQIVDHVRHKFGVCKEGVFEEVIQRFLLEDIVCKLGS
eukprot:CAMPEP_0113668718 /NCGR_PEP_ID=MMETSP0038_2-20120614/4154_1 /TAXON_ID=2898 /ORGANISM="Cryptomonas paramecium" /LENGTH=200 /DNA_ID=CAMNT_0000584489 /DNA_START=260 /DNA_END=862 /DNA_ORIENTATION=+ /assembly_acc=CAM_ASM_000170